MLADKGEEHTIMAQAIDLGGWVAGKEEHGCLCDGLWVGEHFKCYGAPERKHRKFIEAGETAFFGLGHLCEACFDELSRSGKGTSLEAAIENAIKEEKHQE